MLQINKSVFTLFVLASTMQMPESVGDYKTPQDLPGNWKDTCKDAEIKTHAGGRQILFATCRKANDPDKKQYTHSRKTAISLPYCSTIDNFRISNCNGLLACHKDGEKGVCGACMEERPGEASAECPISEIQQYKCFSREKTNDANNDTLRCIVTNKVQNGMDSDFMTKIAFKLDKNA